MTVAPITEGSVLANSPALLDIANTVMQSAKALLLLYQTGKTEAIAKALPPYHVDFVGFGCNLALAAHMALSFMLPAQLNSSREEKRQIGMGLLDQVKAQESCPPAKLYALLTRFDTAMMVLPPHDTDSTPRNVDFATNELLETLRSDRSWKDLVGDEK